MSEYQVIELDDITVLNKNGYHAIELLPGDIDKLIEVLDSHKTYIIYSAEVKHRVARGIDYLNLIRPGWQQLINWDTFDMARTDFCSAGQSGGYYAATRPLSDTRAFELGLNAAGITDYMAYYKVLTAEWRRVCGQ